MPKPNLPTMPAGLALVKGNEALPLKEAENGQSDGLEELVSPHVPVSPMPVKLGAQVLGETGEIYFVTFNSFYGQPFKGWSCTCQDFFYRHREQGTRCKHIHRVVQMFLPERFIY